MPTGFIPSQDSGFVFGIALAGQDISFESMARHLTRRGRHRAARSERGGRRRVS